MITNNKISCERPKFKLNYLSNTDFQDVEINLTTESVLSDFTFIVKDWYRVLKNLNELSGIKKVDDKVFIEGNSLENLPNGNYIGLMYCRIDGEKDLLFTADISVTTNGCATSQNVSGTVVRATTIVNVDISQVINNWGSGGTPTELTWVNIQDKPIEFPPEAHTHSYNDLSDKPIIPESVDISGKQDVLISGSNIKTINGSSILGGGNINISGGDSIEEISLKDIVNKLRNPQKPTIIKLIGDSITAGAGGTGFVADGDIIYGQYRRASLLSTSWANMLYNYVNAKFNNEYLFRFDEPNITVNSPGYTIQTVSSPSIKLLNNSANALAKTGLTFEFCNSTLKLYFYCLKSSGIVNVYVDEVLVSVVDTYNLTVILKEFVIDGLSEGNHVVRLEETNTKNPDATGNFIYFNSAIIKNKSEVVNFGISGLKSYDVNTNKTALINENDDIVILQIGTNNKTVAPYFLRNDIIDIYNYVKSLGKDLIMMIPPPVKSTSEIHPISIVDVCNILIRTAIDYNIPMISNQQAFVNYVRYKGVSFDSLFKDLYHPNDIGHKIIYDNIMEKLEIPIIPEGYTS